MPRLNDTEEASHHLEERTATSGRELPWNMVFTISLSLLIMNSEQAGEDPNRKLCVMLAVGIGMLSGGFLNVENQPAQLGLMSYFTAGILFLPSFSSMIPYSLAGLFIWRCILNRVFKNKPDQALSEEHEARVAAENHKILGLMALYAVLLDLVLASEYTSWPPPHGAQPFKGVNIFFVPSAIALRLLSLSEKRFQRTPFQVHELGPARRRVLSEMIFTTCVMMGSTQIIESMFADDSEHKYRFLYLILASTMVIHSTQKTSLSLKSKLLGLTLMFNIGMYPVHSYGRVAAMIYTAVGAGVFKHIADKFYSREISESDCFLNNGLPVSDHRKYLLNNTLLTVLFIAAHLLKIINTQLAENESTKELDPRLYPIDVEDFRLLIRGASFYFAHIMVIAALICGHYDYAKRLKRRDVMSMDVEAGDLIDLIKIDRIWEHTSVALKSAVLLEAKQLTFVVMFMHVISKLYQEHCQAGGNMIIWSMLLGLLARATLGAAHGATHLGLILYLFALGPAMYVVLPHGPHATWMLSAGWFVGFSLILHHVDGKIRQLPIALESELTQELTPRETCVLKESMLEAGEHAMLIHSFGLVFFSIYCLRFNELLCSQSLLNDPKMKERYFLFGRTGALAIIMVAYYIVKYTWPAKRPQVPEQDSRVSAYSIFRPQDNEAEEPQEAASLRCELHQVSF